MATSTHESFQREEVLKISSDRSFGLVFAGVFSIIGLWPLIRGGNIRVWALAIAALFLAVALIVPSILHQLNVLWMRLAMLLSKITNPIITGLMFYVVFTPAAFLIRAMGKDLLRLQYNRSAASYWIPRQPPGPPPASMSQQF